MPVEGESSFCNFGHTSLTQEPLGIAASTSGHAAMIASWLDKLAIHRRGVEGAGKRNIQLENIGSLMEAWHWELIGFDAIGVLESSRPV